MRSYKITLGPAKPEDADYIGMHLLQRIQQKELAQMATDRIFPAPPIAARKKVLANVMSGCSHGWKDYFLFKSAAS
jgi:hypothetical protein